jgi:hypothetical protein
MVLARIEATKKFRLDSKAEATRKFAKTPAIFCQVAQPDSEYLLVPRVSSERRKYIPIGFMPSEMIANDQVLIIPNATLYHFGILNSYIHNEWMRTVAGKLKSDYRYSKDIVYNNFPFPQIRHSRESGNPVDPRVKHEDDAVTKIEYLAQAILDARAEFPNSSLADLYNPLTMPPKLLKAHEALDRAVDKLYRKEGFKSDTERVAHLFELNQKLTSLVVDEPKKISKKGK